MTRFLRMKRVLLPALLSGLVAAFASGQEPPGASGSSSSAVPAEILTEWKIQAREDVERYGATLKEWKLKAREATSFLEIAQARLNQAENTTAKGYTPKVMVRMNQAERLSAEAQLLACEAQQKDAEVHFNRASRKLARLERGTADPVLDAPDSVMAMAQIASDLNLKMNHMRLENLDLERRIQILEKKPGVGG
jgi:hypothetical protein